jgi:hypothetical protein
MDPDRSFAGGKTPKAIAASRQLLKLQKQIRNADLQPVVSG